VLYLLFVTSHFRAENVPGKSRATSQTLTTVNECRKAAAAVSARTRVGAALVREVATLAAGPTFDSLVVGACMVLLARWLSSFTPG